MAAVSSLHRQESGEVVWHVTKALPARDPQYARRPGGADRLRMHV